MRMLIFSSVAALGLASPALADGARVQVQSGIDWGAGRGTNATIGGAAGYDFSLGAGAFTGVETSVDKVLASGRDASVSFTGRLGVKADPSDKLYALAGYTVRNTADAKHLGAGWQHNFAGPFYGNVEYRHYFSTQGAPDNSRLTAGVGVHF